MNRILLPQSDGALLKECRISTYRAQGAGGQHVNVTNSAVRLTHIPTGIVVTSQKERSQYLNKIHCLARLREKVAKLNYRKPKRLPTKTPTSVLRKRAVAKKKHAEKKRHRRPPSVEE